MRKDNGFCMKCGSYMDRFVWENDVSPTVSIMIASLELPLLLSRSGYEEQERIVKEAKQAIERFRNLLGARIECCDDDMIHVNHPQLFAGLVYLFSETDMYYGVITLSDIIIQNINKLFEIFDEDRAELKYAMGEIITQLELLMNYMKETTVYILPFNNDLISLADILCKHYSELDKLRRGIEKIRSEMIFTSRLHRTDLVDLAVNASMVFDALWEPNIWFMHGELEIICKFNYRGSTRNTGRPEPIKKCILRIHRKHNNDIFTKIIDTDEARNIANKIYMRIYKRRQRAVAAVINTFNDTGIYYAVDNGGLNEFVLQNMSS